MDIKSVKKIAVIGAGTMGHGVAQVCAQAGYSVNLHDIEDKSLIWAMERIKLNLELLRKYGGLTKKEGRSAVSKIKTSTNLADSTRKADFIFEATPEDENIKGAVFKTLDENCPEETIFATNTSTIMINQLAAAVQRKSKFIGIHWFNPAFLTPLSEIILGEETSEETLNISKQLMEKLGKKTVVCRDSPGFVAARIQIAMYNEAMNVLQENVASAHDIDTAIKYTFGFRLPVIGPLQTVDFGGLDIFLKATEYLYSELKAPIFKPPEALLQKVEAGNLGVKTGSGFYKYDNVEKLTEERDEAFILLLKKLGLRKFPKRRRKARSKSA